MPVNTAKKYITEYVSHWRVRVRVSAKKRIIVNFNFEKHGGKRKALKAATICRQELLEKYDLLDRLNHSKSPDLFASSHKKNPIIGVYKTINYGSLPNLNWTCRFTVDGIDRKTSYAITKYGQKEAFKMACADRYFHAGNLVIINRKAMPCLPDYPYKYFK